MKKKNRQKREWVRSGQFDHHHILNRVNGGQSIASNLVYMDTRRHQAFHLLFHDLTFKEAAELLLRLWKIKESKKFQWTL